MKKILAIDDQPFNLVTIKEIIDHGLSQCIVLTASSGKKGVELAINYQPDTILLDTVMPQMDGFETCKKLKNDDRTKHIPVIMLSALKMDEESRIKGHEAGADSFIIKPIDPDELILQINVMLRIKAAEDEIREEKKLLDQMAQERTYELLESKEGFHEMSDVLSVIVYEHDPDGKLTFINQQASMLLGYTEEELNDSFDIFKIFIPEDRARVKKDIKKLLNGDKIKSPEYTALRKDGSTFPIQIYSSLSQKSNEAIAIRGMAIDITEQKDMDEKRRNYARELEERNEELNAFSHTVAHDLKNPLGTLMGFANILNDKLDSLSDEERKDYLSAILESGGKAIQIINSLLLFARLRKSEIHTENLNMGRIFEEASRHFPEVFKQDKANISVPESWPECWGYGPWVEEVWANYLSNAIKYGGTPAHFEVGAEVIKTGTDHNEMARFWVQDFGPGISQENQKLLFKSFERLDQVDTKGYGLGLSIVRRIIEKLGGNVGVESKPGKGSLFYFTLPTVNKKDPEGSEKPAEKKP